MTQEQHNRNSLKKKGSYKIMCVGESTTAYFLVKEPYPLILEKILNNRRIGINFTVINKGLIGANTADILENLNNNLDIYKPDMVIAMMGINDCGYLAPQLKDNSSFLSKLKIYRLIKLIYLTLTKKQHLSDDKTTKINLKQCNNYIKPPFMEENNKRNQPVACENNEWLHQGSDYADQGAFAPAEEAFKKALTAHPECANGYFQMGWLYQRWNKHAEAEKYFTRGLLINPDNANAYAELAVSLTQLNRPADAEASLKKSIALNPTQSHVLLLLGYLYRDVFHNNPSAERNFRQAIDVESRNYMAYRELARTYIQQKKYAQAEKLFMEFKKKNPANDHIYQDLIQLYEQKGRTESIKEDLIKSEKLREACFWDMTAKNYKLMKKILDERKIKLVCVQYPTRSIKSLKEIFPNTDEILLVDNERNFKDVLTPANFKEYFIDNMFEDFGHCTEKGNLLIATNIAKKILKNIFGK